MAGAGAGAGAKVRDKGGAEPKINNLAPFSKRIMYLKYDKDFNKIRSNKIISHLMCCSEENIRKNLQETLKRLI